jgi:hypothetical protein
MDSWIEHIDLITQAPLAIALLLYMYFSNSRFAKLFESYQKLIDKIIDKLK